LLLATSAFYFPEKTRRIIVSSIELFFHLHQQKKFRSFNLEPAFGNSQKFHLTFVYHHIYDCYRTLQAVINPPGDGQCL